MEIPRQRAGEIAVERSAAADEPGMEVITLPTPALCALGQNLGPNPINTVLDLTCWVRSGSRGGLRRSSQPRAGREEGRTEGLCQSEICATVRW